MYTSGCPKIDLGFYPRLRIVRASITQHTARPLVITFRLKQITRFVYTFSKIIPLIAYCAQANDV